MESTASFTDTHVHFHFEDFESDREEAIQRARDAGVRLFINVGTDETSSRLSIELARRYPDFFAAAGIHPHDAKDAAPEKLRLFEDLLKEEKVVGIGEVGLDFYRDHSPHDVQKEVLLFFIAKHFETGKPLIIHCRDAYPELIEILKKQGSRYTGIIHCFSSDAEIMAELTGLGFCISFAGPLTYKKNDVLREACRQCPSDRLLLETDAPFLPPQSKRGKRNESSYLLETAQTAAEVRGITMRDLAMLTTANARRVFNL